MSLINFLFFFFLLNYSFVQNNIEMNTTCGDKYYNSLNYQCEDCNGEKGIDICYSNGNRISIYTFNSISSTIQCSREKKVLTELDGNRQLLKEPVCANKTFNYTDINNSYISHSDSADISLPPTIDNRRIVYTYQADEFNYYNKACIDGKNERACDFLANLCSLSLYNDISNENTNPCLAIQKLDGLLHNNNIL